MAAWHKIKNFLYANLGISLLLNIAGKSVKYYEKIHIKNFLLTEEDRHKKPKDFIFFHSNSFH